MRILLIEDNLAEARLLQEILQDTGVARSNVSHVKRLREGTAWLKSAAVSQAESDSNGHSVDVVLLDLTLPDSCGLDSLDTLLQVAPHLPIVVLTNTNSDELAVEAVRRGAQDYLIKRFINHNVLLRSLHYAIERKQVAEALRETNQTLELQVQDRTLELATSNELLGREVEQRQKIQERLELAQRAGKIGSFEWHIPSNQVTWTAELAALYELILDGANSTHSLSGHEQWMRTLHPDDRLKVEQEFWQAAHLGQKLDIEFRSLNSKGEIRWIAIKGSTFHDEMGKPLRMIGIHMDITEKKQLEAQFLRAQRLESLGTLAGGIAHDLNNILTPILTVSQLLPLKFRDLDEQTEQLLQTLQTSAQRGANLVKQILSFTRGVEGKRECLLMQHLLAEIEQIMRQTLPKSIAIHTDIPSDLWTVFGDATQLHQVLVNLCVNASDAMPNGGSLQITAANLLVDEEQARLHLDAHPGCYVVITISDTGIGIPLDILHCIFDPFFTTKEIGKGTGLGLAAVIGIVKSHSGFVDVQSQVSQGSQFKVYLPASQSPAMLDNQELISLHGQEELILVVDDEITISEVIKTTLETYNYRVLAANNGIEAIKLYAQHQDHVHAALIDMMMPTMDGLTLISLMRDLNPTVNVIAMSGVSSVEVVTQAKNLGCQNFLSKPFTTTALLQSLC